MELPKKINFFEANEKNFPSLHKIVIIEKESKIKDIVDGNIIITNGNKVLMTPLGPCVGIVGRKTYRNKIAGFLVHLFSTTMEEGIKNLEEELRKFKMGIEEFNVLGFGGNMNNEESYGNKNRAKLKKLMPKVQFAHEPRKGNSISYDIKRGEIKEVVREEVKKIPIEVFKNHNIYYI